MSACALYLQIFATWFHQSEDQPREVAGDSHPGCEHPDTFFNVGEKFKSLNRTSCFLSSIPAPYATVTPRGRTARSR